MRGGGQDLTSAPVEQFVPLIGAVVPIYLLMVLGGFLRRVRVLTPQMDDGLMRFVVHVLFPSLILDKILGSEVVRDPMVVGSAIGLGFAFIATGFGVAALTGLLIGLHKGSGRRSFTLTAGIQNYGFTAIPLLLVLFPENEKGALAVLFTHGIGVEIALWTLGMMILRGSPASSPKTFLNGPIVAVVTGLFLVWTGWDRLVPGVIHSLLGWLGPCAFPTALVMIGTAIFDLLGKEKLSLRISLGAIAVRMALMPLIILTTIRFLPLALELKQVLLVQAAMPAAVTPIVLARHYGGSPGAAMQVVLATHLVAIVTIPLIIALGRAWIGV